MKKLGYVALIGLPNAGKSTLLNQILQEKVSIVSRKAQTTRMQISGILTEGETQIVFVDTPGIFQPSGRLGKSMVKSVWQAVDGADLVVLVVDVTEKNGDKKIAHMLEALQHRDRQVIVALNKIDKVKRVALLPMAQDLMAQDGVSDIFMISALKDDGVHDLRHYLMTCMPEGEWMYEADQLSDMPARVLVAELTREQVFHFMHDEIPYGITVVTEDWQQKDNGQLHISQTILVAKDQHRAMVLGKKGESIKKIGTEARQEMQNMLSQRVHLDLHVKVDPNWQDRPEHYQSMGLEF